MPNDFTFQWESAGTESATAPCSSFDLVGSCRSAVKATIPHSPGMTSPSLGGGGGGGQGVGGGSRCSK